MADQEKKVTETEETPPTVEIIEKPPTKQRIKTDEMEDSRLSKLLGDLQVGWKVSIIRTAPSWCKGHLETVEVYSPDETIDVEYLISTWGGQRIQLKVHRENGDWLGGGTVSLFSYPPKVHGELITLRGLNRQMGINQVQQQPGNPNVPHYPMGTAPGVQQLDMNKMIQMMQGSKKEDLALIMKLIDKNQTANTPPANQLQPMIEQMMGMFSLFGQMKTMFNGDLGPAPSGGGGEESMIPMIGELIKGVMTKPQAARPMRPAQPGIVGPRSVSPPPPQSVGTPPPAGNPQPANNLDDVVKQITSLSPTDAADVMSIAFGTLPEDARNVATTRFMKNMTEGSEEDELDDSSIDNDTYQDEDNYTPPDTGQ